jgi:hypothetical protein
MRLLLTVFISTLFSYKAYAAFWGPFRQLIPGIGVGDVPDEQRANVEWPEISAEAHPELLGVFKASATCTGFLIKTWDNLTDDVRTSYVSINTLIAGTWYWKWCMLYFSRRQTIRNVARRPSWKCRWHVLLIQRYWANV